MSRRKTLILVFGIIGLVGAGYAFFDHRESAVPIATSRPQYVVGDVDEQGRLVFLSLARGVYKSLDYAYGMRILQPDETRHDTIRYELYSQADKRIAIATSLDTLEPLIAAVPKGETIYNYNKACSYMSFCRDENILSQVETLCQKYGITFTDAEFVICTCPN